MKKTLAFLLAATVLAPALAFGQAAVRQNGAVKPGNIPLWTQDHQIQDSGTPLSSLTPSSGAIPTAITAGLNLYVSPAGTDTGNCQVQLTPCKTITYAINQGYGYDLKSASGTSQTGQINVNIAAGSYNEAIAINGIPRGSAKTGCCNAGWVNLIGSNGSGSTSINGDPAQCYTIASSWGANVTLTGLTLTTSNGNACASALFAQLSGVIQVYTDVVFGVANAQHMHAEEYGDIEIWNSYTINGNALEHWGVSQFGLIDYNPNPVVITINTPRTFSFFGVIQTGGQVHLGAATSFSTTAVTGAQFNMSGGGILTTYSTNTQTIPGSLPGYMLGQNTIFPEKLLGFRIVTTPTSCGAAGLGTGCSITVLSGSTSRVGRIQLGTGTTGVGSSGTFQVNLGVAMQDELGVGMFCQAFPSNNGNTSWATGTVTLTSALNTAVPDFLVNWASGTLTASSLYTIDYRCGG